MHNISNKVFMAMEKIRMSQSEIEVKKPSRTIIRLIVIEGDPEWVQMTLDRSLLPMAGMQYPARNCDWMEDKGNSVRCVSLVDKPTDMIGKKYLDVNVSSEEKESI